MDRSEELNVDAYFTSMKRMLDVFDRESRKAGFRAGTLTEYAEWAKSTRLKLQEITGMASMEACVPSPRLIESVQLDGYRRDKMMLRTEPDVWMPFYVLIPDAAKQKNPCIIAPHGHESGGKLSVSGRSDLKAVQAQIDKYHYDYGVQFVRRGYIVFCPDARAFGERREWTKQGNEPELFLNSSCVQLNHMAIPLGQSVTGMWTWDLMRLVDYIESRPDCGTIGCAGLSGGGLQTLWLAAMDERIQCAAVSGYFYGYKDALLKLSDNCACNYVPNLWKYVDMGDLGALIAPRPLLIESGSRDPLNGERGLANVTEQLEITRQAYELFGKEERLRHYVFDGEHRWDGAETYDFFNCFLTW